MKKLIALLLTAIMIVCAAGCGKGNDDGADKRKKATEAPTETPTAEPTAEPTPAPKPVVSVEEGPSFAVGRAVDDIVFYHHEEQIFTTSLDFIYITEDGYDALAAAVKKLGNENYVNVRRAQTAILEWSEETDRQEEQTGITQTVTERRHYNTQIVPFRNDSVVFSFIQKVESVSDGMPQTSRKGYSLKTATGEALTLSEVIKDKEELKKAICEEISTKYAAAAVLVDNWEQVVSEAVDKNTLPFVCSDLGIFYWFEDGQLFRNTSLQHDGTVLIEEHPGAFAEEYAGPYEDGMKKVRTDRQDPQEAFTEIYDYLMPRLFNGVGKLDYSECAALLTEKGIEFSGLNEKEAEYYEMQPHIYFYDPMNGDKIELIFWPDNREAGSSRQSITMIYVMPAHMDGFVLVDDRYHEMEVMYRVIDRSFKDENGFSGQMAVSFPNWQEALGVMVQSFYLYYPELKAAE